MHKEATIERKGTQRDEQLAEGCKYVAKGSQNGAKLSPKGAKRSATGAKRNPKGAKREQKVKPEFVQKTICGKVGKRIPQRSP